MRMIWVVVAGLWVGCGGAPAGGGAGPGTLGEGPVVLPPPTPVRGDYDAGRIEASREAQGSCGFAIETANEEERHLRETAAAVPVRVAGIEDAVEVDVFLSSGCIRRARGTVSCFDLRTGNVTDVPGIDDARSVALGHHGGCAVRASGTMTCWSGVAPSAGTPLLASTDGVPPSAVLVPGGDLGAVCAVAPAMAPACYGVSYGSAVEIQSPTRVEGISDLVELGLGNDVSCLRRGDGTVLCDGDDGPVTVANVGDAVAITAGTSHACVRSSGGDVSCWGENLQGQLGDGSTVSRPARAARVSLSGAARDVAAGVMHTCAVLASGEVECWGWNDYGQLGDGTLTSRPSPVRVRGLVGAVAVAAHLRNTCALLRDGTVACWGALAMCLAGDCAVQ